MEKNCLLTRFKGVVDDNDLLKIGELRFWIKGTASINVLPQSDTVTLSIIEGDGTFDRNGLKQITLSPSDSYAASITATGPCVVSINDKYNLKRLQVGNPSEQNDANTLYYCEQLEFITGFFWEHEDLINYIGKASLQQLYLRVKSKFNIDDIVGYDNLVNLTCTEDVSGNINTINDNFPKLNTLRLGGAITGDASLFANSAENSLPILMGTESNYINNILSWGTTRQSVPFLELIFVNLGDDLDAMLLNQANLTYSGPDVSSSETRGLLVYGTLTESTEITNAINAIKAKGLPVRINGRKY